MSYDVELKDPLTGEVYEMDEVIQEGGTQQVGGHNKCHLNITYNYSEVFDTLVRDLHQQPVSSTLTKLKKFVQKWKHAKPYERDYWAPTPGNAVHAIKILVSFAKKHPLGVWEVS